MQNCDANTCDIVLHIEGDPQTNKVKCNATDPLTGNHVFQLACNMVDSTMYKSYTACSDGGNLDATYSLDKTVHATVDVTCSNKDGLEFSSTANTSLAVDFAGDVSQSSFTNGQLQITLGGGSLSDAGNSFAYIRFTVTHQNDSVEVIEVSPSSITFDATTGQLVVAGLDLDGMKSVQVEFALQNAAQYQQVSTITSPADT